MRGAVLGDRGISIRLEGSWNMFGSYEDKGGGERDRRGSVNNNSSGGKGPSNVVKWQGNSRTQ